MINIKQNAKNSTNVQTDSIIEATKKGDDHRVKKILQIDPDAIYETEVETGFTALHYACYYVNGPIIRLLLAQPANTVHQKDHNGRWPIHYILIAPDQDLIDALEVATFPEEPEFDGPVNVHPFPTPKP